MVFNLIILMKDFDMNRIKELRKKQDKTLQNVADETGLSNGTIANYENEKREPKLETWKKLADYFGVDVGYIQGITDVKNSHDTEYSFDKLFLGLNKRANKEWMQASSNRVMESNSEDLTKILEVMGEDEFNNDFTNLEARQKLYVSLSNFLNAFIMTETRHYEGANWEWLKIVNEQTEGVVQKVLDELDGAIQKADKIEKTVSDMRGKNEQLKKLPENFFDSDLQKENTKFRLKALKLNIGDIEITEDNYIKIKQL